MSIAPGVRLGAYEILAFIGAGGMGEVYRAHDTILNRDVALKVLPEPVSSDPDRLARFTREAQTLAALNHPSIAHVYGLDRHEAIGRPALAFIVMELVEGEDLAQRIARGPVAIDESVAIAAQIAEALEAAHEHGIIHRDLKPANIKVRPDGAVKILDFGLAKAIDRTMEASGGAGWSMSPTLTSPAMTAAGIILGTAAYMAPEQAKGKAVDKRADIWAFGVVLYEMLTGRTLFAGESVAETIGLLVTREPDWTALPAATPERIQSLLRRCLTRDPRNRLRDIGEARILLTTAEDAASPVRTTPSRRRWTTAAVVAAVAAFVAGAIAGRVVPGGATSTTPLPLRRFELAASIAAASVGPVLSRDGSRMAFIAGNHLRVQSLDALDSQDLGPMPVTAANIFWSPDGKSIGFTANAMIHVVPAAGGPTFVVCRIPASGSALDVLWRADGTILVAVWRDSLYKVPATGGTPEIFLRMDPGNEVDFHGIAELPRNRFIITTHLRDADPERPGADREQREVYDGTRRTILTTVPNLGRFTYAAPGYLLFARTDANSGVWVTPFADGPVDLSKAVRIEAGANRFTAAEDGTLLASIAPSAPSKAELIWFDRRGAITAIPGSAFDAHEPGGHHLALSPDGRRAVYITGDTPAVVVRDLASGLDTRLTFDRHDFDSPSWFPDGNRVIYMTDVAMTRAPAGGAAGTSFRGKITAQRADGTDRSRELGAGSGVPRLAADGKTIVFILDDTGRGRLHIAPIAADGTAGTARPFFRGDDEPNVRWFDLSRDGRLLAYAAEDPSTRRLDVFLTEFPAATGRWLVHAGGNMPQFSTKSDELFFTSGVTAAPGEAKGRFNVVPIASHAGVRLGPEMALFDLEGQMPRPTAMGYAVAPDGQKFLAARLVTPENQRTRRVVLIQNWMAALPK